MKLIAGADVLILIEILLIVVFAMWSERTSFGKKASAALIALVSGAIFSNLGLLPYDSYIYGTIASYIVPFAIVLLLLKANLRQVFTHTGGLVFVFLICIVATVLGGIIGFFVLPLGAEASKLFGIYIASFTGGSMNFVAVSQALELNDAGLLSAALASEAIVATAYLVVLIIMTTSTWFIKAFPATTDLSGSALLVNDHNIEKKGIVFIVKDTPILLISGVGISWLSIQLAEYFSEARFSLLFITFFTIVIANLFANQLKNIHGDFEIGMFLMYIFFVVVGAGANVSVLFNHGPVLILYAVIICVIHVGVLLLAGKLFRFNYAELITASNACILGPTPAAALAAHNKWQKLITPGLLCGILGYVIANFLGVSLAIWIGGY